MVSNRSKVLSVRLPNDIADKIVEIAKKCRTSPSQLMTHMLHDWLDKHGHFKEEKRK